MNLKLTAGMYGDAVLDFLSTLQPVLAAAGDEVVIAAGAADLSRISLWLEHERLDTQLWAQHVDAVAEGSHTGYQLAEAVAAAGATGTLLNHSEHRFTHSDELSAAHDAAKRAGLVTCVCAESVTELTALATLDPDYLAYEPPELIGGDISVSTSQPEVIEAACQAVDLPVLVGAGVKSAKDVEIAQQLGAVGVLVASGITKSADPATALSELLLMS